MILTSSRGVRCGLLYLLALGGLLSGCTRKAPRPVTPRRALRADVLGCWRLALASNAGAIMAPPQSPAMIRLDSLPVGEPTDGSRRSVQRFTANGASLERDPDGRTLHDSWSADSTSDRIAIEFDAGGRGSHWLLTLDRDAHGGIGMRGTSQAFSETVTVADSPWLTVHASRVMCTAAGRDSDRE